MNQKSLWEAKAKHFPRFVKDTKDTLEILDFFISCGVVFEGKSILDIGCGNGRFALELAKKAKHIHAMDMSESMLAALQEDSQKLNFFNISTYCSSWEMYDLSKLGSIDIAFASMTPALNNFHGFTKALHASKEGLCYVGWGRVRKSAFLESIFSDHRLSLELPVGLPQVLDWLTQMKIPTPPYCYKSANYEYKADIHQAMQDIRWHIQIHGGIPDEEIIAHHIEAAQSNGHICYMQEREIGLCFIPH